MLPFLLGDRLAGRVDLRANRREGVLEVLGAWSESHAEGVAEPLALELRALAAWLELRVVQAAARGNLARALKACLRPV